MNGLTDITVMLVFSELYHYNIYEYKLESNLCTYIIKIELPRPNSENPIMIKPKTAISLATVKMSCNFVAHLTL